MGPAAFSLVGRVVLIQTLLQAPAGFGGRRAVAGDALASHAGWQLVTGHLVGCLEVGVGHHLPRGGIRPGRLPLVETPVATGSTLSFGLLGHEPKVLYAFTLRLHTL